MKKRDLIRRLRELEVTSRSDDVYLKSPGRGQWGELVLRRASSEEKQRARIAPDKRVAVIAAEGDNRLTLNMLLSQVSRLPEIAEVYVMLYPDDGPDRPADLAILGLQLLHEDGRERNVVALSAQETPDSLTEHNETYQ